MIWGSGQLRRTHRFIHPTKHADPPTSNVRDPPALQLRKLVRALKAQPRPLLLPAARPLPIQQLPARRPPVDHVPPARHLHHPGPPRPAEPAAAGRVERDGLG